MKSKKLDEKQKEKERRRQEIEEIFINADKKTSEQTFLDGFGNLQTEDELKHFSLGSIPDDPEKKYDVYYKGIERLLKTFLPKGPKNKIVRKMIREEKKIFLTRGKKLDPKGIRHGDSRMGYINDMEMVMNLIVTWAF